MRLAALAIPIVTAAYASAHGYLHSLTIDGHSYSGNKPGAANKPSAIRLVADQGPVKGAKSKDMNCGLGSPKVAALDATANPGDSISFDWTAIDGGNWIHEVGPMITYMASCGNQDCNKFDSTKAKWFKIDQQGQVPPASGTWAQKQIFDGKSFKVTLPKNIAPGNYLVRQEIIALHNGLSPGGAEFYPSCSQLKIGGSGTGKPQPDELVSFPGAYNDRDPGILVPDIFNPGFKYQFPGPKIASFVTGGSDSGNYGHGGDAGSSSHGAPSSTATPKKPVPTEDTPQPSGQSSKPHGASSTSSSKKPSPTQNNTNAQLASKCKSKRALRSSDRSVVSDDDSRVNALPVNVKHHRRHINRVRKSAASFGSQH